MSIQESTPGEVYGSVEQPHLERPSRKCCTVKYRTRYFYSKGAFLVLVWLFFISMSIYPVCEFFWLGIRISTNHLQYSVTILTIIILPNFVLILFTGWLADAKLGNYKVFKAGAVLGFQSTIAGGLAQAIITFYNLKLSSTERLIVGGLLIISGSMGIIGITSSVCTALQLGLDQMPDASAVNVSSFIAWFVAVGYGGYWVYSLLVYLMQDYAWQNIIITLQPALCMAIVCSTIFILAPKYLILEPKSPQSLKIIYQVLKFAAKHKAPLNRSALTYWEEDIPSRLDLGKSKYGGPFTIEQVENVKTFFKLLLILVPIAIMGAAATASFAFVSIDYLHIPWISVVFYEFAIYPLFHTKLPTILRRIGTLSVVIFIVECLRLSMSVTVSYIMPENNLTTTLTCDTLDQFTFWANLIINFLNGSMVLFSVIGILEFVCAQSSYSMRGFLTSCYVLAVLCSSIWFIAFLSMFNSYWIHIINIIVLETVAVALILLGFILYCVLARWYKLRVRDEEYNVHRVVEEVYDRYLSHRSYR